MLQRQVSAAEGLIEILPLGCFHIWEVIDVEMMKGNLQPQLLEWGARANSAQRLGPPLEFEFGSLVPAKADEQLDRLERVELQWVYSLLSGKRS